MNTKICERIDSEYNNWSADLEEKFLALHDDATYHIWDGVISPHTYHDSALKVLFINKEAYDEDGEEYNLVDIIRQYIEAGKTYFPNQSALKSSLRKELAIIKAVISDSTDSAEDIVGKYTMEDFTEDFYGSAYINVKKSDGEKKSATDDLSNHAQTNQKILEEQIQYFNPSIIVGGNVVDGILENIFPWGENLNTEEQSVKIYQLKIGTELYPYLDLYHPTYAQGIKPDEILRAMRKIQQKYPNFWKNRLNRPCFKRTE